jgi:hypothetical protein
MPASLGPKSGRILFTHAAVTDTVTVTGTGTGSGTEIAITEQFGTGWQLISLPLLQACINVPGNLFLYRSSYLQTDTLYNGIGYWKKLATPEMRFVGYPLDAETVAVRAGWNIIGSITTPVQGSSIATLPANNLSSQFFGYATAYFLADSIRPGHAYWVKAKQPGALILRNAPAAEQTAEQYEPPAKRSLTIEDAEGYSQRLYLDEEPRVDPDRFLLPPLPPAGGFDARFRSGRLVEWLSGEEPRELPFILSTSAYPVTIRWDMSGLDRKAVLRAENGETPMAGVGSFTLAREPQRLSILLNTEQTLPGAFALYQNYPNPFNPSTVIRYDLPVESRILLRVYNTLGQEMAVVAREVQPAGAHSLTFRASLPSGLYYYGLEAVSTRSAALVFRSSRKMVLIK